MSTVNYKVSAVVPAFNEEIAIGSVVLSTRKYVDQVVVVDDGSSDRTAEIALMAGALVVKHSKNQGKGAALKTGFESVDSDSDIVITLDGDGQHDPEEILKLIQPIKSGESDMVIGSRYLHNAATDTPIYRRFGQMVLNKATNFNSGLEITDTQSGFRAFSSYALPALRFDHKGYSIESGMLIDAAHFGLMIKEVSTSTRYNTANSHKKNPLSHGVSVLLGLMQEMEFYRPLYLLGVPGLILIILGFAFVTIFFGEYLNHHSPLILTIIAATMALAGLFIAFTGIILHSMTRLIDRSNIGK